MELGDAGGLRDVPKGCFSLPLIIVFLKNENITSYYIFAHWWGREIDYRHCAIVQK